jgi:hypothetical protein
MDTSHGSKMDELCRLLAQHVPTTAAEADGSTSLHYAAGNDNLDIADLLIANGARVSAATRYDITPLSIACDHGNARREYKIDRRLLLVRYDQGWVVVRKAWAESIAHRLIRTSFASRRTDGAGITGSRRLRAAAAGETAFLE